MAAPAVAFPDLNDCPEECLMLSQLARHGVAFLKDDSGPTAVEYAVMMALIIVVCFASIGTLGTNANKTFTKVATTLNSTAS
jgi:pilus assembly protein Flp/PilA